MQRADKRIELIRNAGPGIRPVVDFTAAAAAEADHLRGVVYKALSSLPADERSDVRDKLLSELEKAGLSVCECLFMLGVSAATADELTAPEIAALIRYVRLSELGAMMAVAAPLRELLTVADPGGDVSGRAAPLAK